MKDIPDFAEASRQFLASWLRMDILLRCDGSFEKTCGNCRSIECSSNARHPQRTRRSPKGSLPTAVRGALVEISAVAAVEDYMAATIWFPKLPDEEVQGWNRGMKLTICQPLSNARAVATLWWHLLMLLPRFRRYQKTKSFIGTRAWAASIVDSLHELTETTRGMSDTITLYRPVGQHELDLIIASGYRAFPRRLPEQPIFYPVLNEAYARQIARDWNTRHNDPPVGYVTRFHIRAGYLQEFDVHVVGGSQHAEYWIPAEELDEFNRNIVGSIQVIAEYGKEDVGGPDTNVAG
jgi:hypothetical protein